MPSAISPSSIHWSCFLSPAVQEEVSSLETRLVFGASLDLDLLGIEVDANTLIPGLAVASSRAKPLAGMIPYLKFHDNFACTAGEFSNLFFHMNQNSVWRNQHSKLRVKI